MMPRSDGGPSGRFPWLLSAVVFLLLAAIGSILFLNRALFRQRITSGESSAIAALKTLVVAERPYVYPEEIDARSSIRAIVAAEHAYRARFGAFGSLRALSACNPPLLDPELGEGRKGAYAFSAGPGRRAEQGFRAEATPLGPANASVPLYHLSTDETGRIREEATP